MFGFIKTFFRIVRIGILHIRLKNQKILPFPDQVLLIAPHPDDEIIGCAGLIQQLLQVGKEVNVVILTGGGKSHVGCCAIDEKVLIENRRNLAKKAAGIVGLPLQNLHFLDYPDGGITVEHPETKRLKQLLEELKPEAVFVPHYGEGWNDHIVVERIVKQLIGKSSVIQLYEYCVWFWYYNVWRIDWKNAYCIRMNPKQHVTKLKAMEAYITPLAPCGKPWSGVLPKVFVWANQWNKELYFKV